MNYKEVLSIRQHAMNKTAGGPYTDYVVGGLSSFAIPGASAVGTLHGALSDPMTEEEEEDLDKHPATAQLPGVASSRTMRRLKRQNMADDGSQRHTWAQALGPLTSLLAATALGAGVGAGFGGQRGDVKGGAIHGAQTGAITAGALGLQARLRALFNRTRTKEEQRAYANSGTAGEYLIPGQAAYNSWKSYGRAHADSVERDEKRKKEKA